MGFRITIENASDNFLFFFPLQKNFSLILSKLLFNWNRGIRQLSLKKSVSVYMTIVRFLTSFYVKVLVYYYLLLNSWHRTSKGIWRIDIIYVSMSMDNRQQLIMRKYFSQKWQRKQFMTEIILYNLSYISYNLI